MELDSRIGEYAAAIVRDMDLLLADSANLTEQQQKFAEALKRIGVGFVSEYDELLPYCVDRTIEPGAVLYRIRAPLSVIRGYCELFLNGQIGDFDPAQRQLIQQIESAQAFILDAFMVWMNSKRGESKDA